MFQMNTVDFGKWRMVAWTMDACLGNVDVADSSTWRMMSKSIWFQELEKAIRTVQRTMNL